MSHPPRARRTGRRRTSKKHPVDRSAQARSSQQGQRARRKARKVAQVRLEAGSRKPEAEVKKAWVYVDGFNLYYGALKETPYRWLDIRRMCELLLPELAIERIKYFTARVSGRIGDPGKPTRQQIYLRALRTLPGLEILLGRFLSHDVMMALALPKAGAPKFALVVKTEEKGSDVNIASHMIHDAHQKRFDVAVLVTNDSDLLEPVRIVRRELGIPVGILNPHRYTPSKVLMPYATFVKVIRQGVLAASQLPESLRDGTGVIRKPQGW